MPRPCAASAPPLHRLYAAAAPPLADGGCLIDRCACLHGRKVQPSSQFAHGGVRPDPSRGPKDLRPLDPAEDQTRHAESDARRAAAPIGPARLAEILGRLSLVFDSARDTAPGTSVRCAVLAVELGRRAGATEEELAAAYWEPLLGQMSTPDQQTALGDLDTGSARSSLLSLSALHALADEPWGGIEGANLTQRLRAVGRLCQEPSRSGVHHLSPSRGLGAGAVPEETVPTRRDGLELARRLHQLSRLVEGAHRRAGRGAALELARRAAEPKLDAHLAATFVREHAALFDALEAPRIFERFLELEHGPLEWVDDRQLDDVAVALATLIESRTPILLGHSLAVANLAERAARHLELPAEECRALRLAALLHEVARVSVPNRIWMCPGPLDWAAWERVRLQPYQTERMLAPIAQLSQAAEIAASVHERMDGSGYPHRRSGRSLSVAQRVLGAADVAIAMGEHRPHRPPHSRAAITRQLIAEARMGRLDRKAVDAVLAGMGVAERVPLDEPHGLSEREQEVLCLLARGMSDKEIGAMLRISPRTVQVHVSRILDKLGVRSRVGAAVWWIEHER